MPAHVRFELGLIAALLVAVAAFAFWYVPLSIDVPQGFGADSEVSPRFAPYLLAGLMAAAMAARLVALGAAWARGALDAVPDDIADRFGTPEETRRGVVLNALTHLYGFVLIPVAGFYVASFALVGYLVRRLGERRVWMALFVGVACAVFVYLLFDRLLSVRLPRGALGDLLRQIGD